MGKKIETPKESRKGMPIWKHYLIAFSAVALIFTGMAIGWFMRSSNQSEVNAQAKVLVDDLKSQK